MIAFLTQCYRADRYTVADPAQGHIKISTVARMCGQGAGNIAENQTEALICTRL